MAKTSPRMIEVAARLARIAEAAPSEAQLLSALRLLAKWRSGMVATTLAKRSGTVVAHGPFAGMVYGVGAVEGGAAPRLLGLYEASLTPVIEKVIGGGYGLVIDVGCAEGYYAVGLARRMPGVRVMARDSDARAQGLCRDLAALNGVADRVEVGGVLTHDDFALCADQKTFVLCDIEGAEDGLLDPALAPGLAHADLLVEVHEGASRGLLARLTQRFAPTHTVTRIDRALSPAPLPGWMEELSDLDRLLAYWEWRAKPTPWLWMERRA
ncbi:class I SAM-dependent methyltransferase [Fuscibacter oryzae]|uniref:Uncharacterized protein n=1 Tax=Fuscibacter oryzae TaxID=2803939 RepID=A0A8J7MPC9_9RHOB|nr:hypothetical protein [Fuscibacter oryzae]MBL4928635.1 hypothetical protein [Fuscibacter oryzae]